MSIIWLELIAIAAATLIITALLIPVIRWIVEVVEARNRRRHAVRRRARAKGYLPVHDEQWDPRV